MNSAWGVILTQRGFLSRIGLLLRSHRPEKVKRLAESASDDNAEAG